MEIAVFVKNLTSGGAEKQSVLLAKVLSQKYQVHYLIFNAEKIHQKYINLLEQNTSISIISFHGVFLKRFWNLIKYLRKYKINILFSYLTGANFIASIASLFSDTKVYVGLRNARLPLLKRWLDRISTNYFSQGAIANCYSGREYFISHGFKKDKVSVIPNCFDSMADQNKTAHEYVNIIIVGRFVPQKDYETAIRSFSILCKNNSNVKLHIVGYGELESNVKAWVNEYNVAEHTHIYINPNNIQALLNASDIYLSTSLFEGTSNSIMEAMNAELPIVATNVGDNEYLVHDGKNGFLCPTKDCCFISNIMDILVKNEVMRKEFGKYGKRLLQTDFSIEKFSENYHKIIDASVII